MQPNSERRVCFRKFDGLVECVTVYHQAGSGKNSIAMGADNGLVDRVRTPEVIRVDD